MKLPMAFVFMILFNIHLSSQSENCTSNDVKCDHKDAVQRLANSLSNIFHDIITKELLPDPDNMLDTKTSHRVAITEPTDDELLSEITEKLNHKLSSALKTLKEMNHTLSSNASSYTHPCPYKVIHKPVLPKTYELFDNVSSTTEEYQDDDSFEELKIKRQYFLSHIDYATDKDCTTMPHSNLRYLYHKVVNPDPKLVIFIIDNSVSANAIQYAVNIIKEITQALQTTDLLALKITNTTDFVKFKDSCSTDKLADISNATDSNKILLKEYLLTIDSPHPNIPHLTINEELKTLLAQRELPKHKLIVFLTDTKVLTDESWPKMFPYPVKEDDTIKLAIGVINEGEATSSLEILHFDKWHNHSKSHSLMRVHISDGGVVGQAASAFISLLPQNHHTAQALLLSPVWEPTDRDFTVSLVLPVVVGVLGLDLYWTDLAEDIIYFPHSDIERRAFVIDYTGRLIMHSYFPRPELTSEKIKFTQLDNVEKYDASGSLAAEILATERGRLSRVDAANRTVTYSWRRAGSHYAACVVSLRPAGPEPAPVLLPQYPRATDLLFHRLDLAPPRGGKLCRHFKQLATLDQGTVYLSPSSFRSPFTYLRESGGGGYLRNCLAYLRSVARGLLANPGLRGDVQRDVAYLSALLPAYRRRSLSGPLARYSVRRYAGADSGALAVFPGAVLERDYEPLRRSWHARARRQPGRAVLAPPALDAGGAGYVVTLSYRPPASAPRVVLAIDLTLGYLHRLVLEAQPACGAAGARCFLIDARGYLLAHPALQGPAAAGPVERRHVTHQESLIAIDMLTRRQLVAKRECRAPHDGSGQRYYEFNTSLAGVLSNAGPGEPCLRYYIAAVPRTEALVALVAASCSPGAFCPCSMVDRSCLNCRRMEQTECECPCECAAVPRECAAVDPVAPSPPPPPPPCEPQHETDDHKSHYFHNLAENLKPCVEAECGSLPTQAACRGAVGCEWCQAEGEARAPLAAPFCAAHALCWSGVLGSVTPYGEGTYREAAGGAGALGPVAGCLVTAGLVCAVAAYCYRQGGGGGSGGGGGPSTGGAALYEGANTWGSGSATATGAAGSAAEGEGAGGAGRERLLPAPVSPYRVVGGVRCARAAGSDHGYSTMTPHEDSEAAGEAPAAPAPVPPAPGPGPSPGTASAPTTRVLAPVTVHRHMEALAEMPPPLVTTAPSAGAAH